MCRAAGGYSPDPSRLLRKTCYFCVCGAASSPGGACPFVRYTQLVQTPAAPLQTPGVGDGDTRGQEAVPGPGGWAVAGGQGSTRDSGYALFSGALSLPAGIIPCGFLSFPPGSRCPRVPPPPQHPLRGPRWLARTPFRHSVPRLCFQVAASLPRSFSSAACGPGHALFRSLKGQLLEGLIWPRGGAPSGKANTSGQPGRAEGESQACWRGLQSWPGLCGRLVAPMGLFVPRPLAKPEQTRCLSCGTQMLPPEPACPPRAAQPGKKEGSSL